MNQAPPEFEDNVVYIDPVAFAGGVSDARWATSRKGERQKGSSTFNEVEVFAIEKLLEIVIKQNHDTSS